MNELWVVTSDLWDRAGSFVMRRVEECWGVLLVAWVDREEEGTVFQKSLVGSVGIASFCFVGGSWPPELKSLWLPVKPVIVGT